jgi:hypothetical protein
MLVVRKYPPCRGVKEESWPLSCAPERSEKTVNFLAPSEAT